MDDRVKRLLLYGDMRDHLLARRLCRTLDGRGPVLFCGGEVLSAPAAPPRIALWEADHLRALEMGEALLYLKPRCDLRSLCRVDGRTTVVTDSANRAQLRFAARHGLDTVTCGLSGKDTLTFSSRDARRPVVALQRSVQTLDGRVIDPMELPCRLSGRWQEGALLAYVLLLLLLGELHPEPDGGLLLPE